MSKTYSLRSKVCTVKLIIHNNYVIAIHPIAHHLLGMSLESLKRYSSDRHWILRGVQ